ncbi:hypothetical protein [Moraxella oblonga]|uniref:hypothetical protein n=1 Tax=Moraxella oblonga TaxID=200413 RepID=UPI001FE164FA|nr:hypothetical protein [Moraxella oblonga]
MSIFIGLLALTEFAQVPSQAVTASEQVQASQTSGGATTADSLKLMTSLESKRPDEPIKPIAIPTVDNPKAVALGQKLWFDTRLSKSVVQLLPQPSHGRYGQHDHVHRTQMGRRSD